MFGRIMGKILFEDQHHAYIVKVETGKFAGLYANVDIDSDNVWLEALWEMFLSGIHTLSGNIGKASMKKKSLAF